MTKTIDFLELLIDNAARAEILRLFVLNKESFTLAEVARRAGIGVRTARSEIDALRKAGVIKEERHDKNAGKKQEKFVFDAQGKYANAISSFLHEITPEEFGAVETALRRTGRLSVIVLSGVFIGDHMRPADLLVVGDYLNDDRLEKTVKSFEPRYGREIRYAVFSTPEFRYRLTIKDKIIRDILDYPHRILLNRGNIL